MDLRALLRALAAGRVVVGSSLVVAPRFTGRRWIGETADDRAVMVFTRALGIRDLALGVGSLSALTNGEPAKQWTLLSAASDAVDFAATMLAVRRIGLRRAVPVLLVAGTAAAIGVAAAGELDE
jgi:hypothetical protein